MADGSETDVIISGLNPKLPKWATESTLGSIDKNIKTLVASMTKSSGSISGLSDTFENTQESAESFEGALRNLHKTSKSVESGFGKIAKNISLPSIEGLFKGGALAAVGTGVSFFVDYLKTTTQALISLYDTGLTVQNGLGDLRIAAANAQLPLEEFAQILASNAPVIKALGVDGAKSLGSISKRTRELLKDQGFYGLSMRDITDYTVGYLEVLRQQGLLQKGINFDESKASADYIKQLTAYSQIMGKSRKEISEQIQRGLNDPAIQAIRQAMGTQGESFVNTMTNILGSLGGLSGPGVQQMTDDFIRAIGSTSGPVTDLVKGLQAAGRGDLAKEFVDLTTKIRTNKITQEEATEKLTEFFKGVQNLSDNDLKRLAAQSQIEGSSLRTQAQLVSQLNASLKGADFNKVNKALVQEPDSWIESTMRLTDSFRRIQNAFKEVFGKFIVENQDLLDRMINNAANFAEWVANKFQHVMKYVAEIIDPTTRDQAIENILSGFRSIMAIAADKISDWAIAAVDPFNSYQDYRDMRETGKNYSAYSLSGLARLAFPGFYSDGKYSNSRGLVDDKGSQADKFVPGTFSPASSSPAIDKKFKSTQDFMVNSEAAAEAETQSIAIREQSRKMDRLIQLQEENNSFMAKQTEISEDSLDQTKGIRRNSKYGPNVIR